jgi:hypothetical protein
VHALLFKNTAIQIEHIHHSNDGTLSNPAKDFERVTYPWAVAVMSEFFEQGDQERSVNAPITPMNDRQSTVMAKCQIGFVDFVVAPLYEQLVKLCPQLFHLYEQLVENRKRWSGVLKKELQRQVDSTDLPMTTESMAKDLQNDTKFLSILEAKVASLKQELEPMQELVTLDHKEEQNKELSNGGGFAASTTISGNI